MFTAIQKRLPLCPNDLSNMHMFHLPLSKERKSNLLGRISSLPLRKCILSNSALYGNLYQCSYSITHCLKIPSARVHFSKITSGQVLDPLAEWAAHDSGKHKVCKCKLCSTGADGAHTATHSNRTVVNAWPWRAYPNGGVHKAPECWSLMMLRLQTVLAWNCWSWFLSLRSKRNICTAQHSVIVGKRHLSQAIFRVNAHDDRIDDDDDGDSAFNRTYLSAYCVEKFEIVVLYFHIEVKGLS